MRTCLNRAADPPRRSPSHLPSSRPPLIKFRTKAAATQSLADSPFPLSRWRTKNIEWDFSSDFLESSCPHNRWKVLPDNGFQEKKVRGFSVPRFLSGHHISNVSGQMSPTLQRRRKPYTVASLGRGLDSSTVQAAHHRPPVWLQIGYNTCGER